MVAHAGRAHAKLSASGSDRWLSCPGSVDMEKMFPENDSSVYAEEGTFAHELSELHLAFRLDLISAFDHDTRLSLIKLNPFYSQEMEDHVQIYTDIVIERIYAAKAVTPDAVVLLEQRLDFSPWTAPDQFGTGDVLIIADGLLEVIDLKYGKGVEVSAEDNSQLRLYGLGALNGFGFLYDVQAIRMTIVQPRLNNISSEELKVDDLLQWALEVIVPGAALALSGSSVTVAGDHCKFCKARTHCKARAMYCLELEELEYKDPRLLSVEEIAQVLAKAKVLSDWAGDIAEYAFQQAKDKGVRFPGWKLVEGRSNRMYANREAIAETLLIEGFEKAMIYEPQDLLGITAMEKLIGKKQFKALLSDFVIKGSGKPTLVVESDARPELASHASAISDFTDLDA